MAGPLGAHEVPRGVTVHGFLRTVGNTTDLFVRVPLEAMRDIDFPIDSRGYLLFSRADSALRHAAQIWVAGNVGLRQGGSMQEPRVVAVRASLPSDKAFADYGSASLSASRAALPDSSEVPWSQAMLDVHLTLVTTPGAEPVAIETRWARLGVSTTTVLHVIDVEGNDRLLTYEGNPGEIELDPTWFDAAAHFVSLGFAHILDGIDHLLFLICLVIPVRRLLPLVGIVTSFTVAHSITLAASAFGFAPDMAWFPPLVETLIALSIVYMAFENILGAKVERRWMMAFGFGLVHGFGFSFALQESLQFAGGHLVTALGAFNLGVEAGQLLVVAIAVPVLAFVLRRIGERAGAIVISAVVAHQSWHWMTERYADFRAFDISMPATDKLFVAGLMRFALLLVIAGGAMWALSLLQGRLRATRLARSPMLLLLVLLMAGAAIPVEAQSRTTMSGVYTAKQATQGREVFNGSCLGCHTAASHTGQPFTSRWLGQSLEDLMQFLSTQMPKSAPGSLTEDEYLWVTAYLLRLNGMPAGDRDLSGDPAVLKQIRIDTVSTRRSSLLPAASRVQHWGRSNASPGTITITGRNNKR